MLAKKKPQTLNLHLIKKIEGKLVENETVEIPSVTRPKLKIKSGVVIKPVAIRLIKKYEITQQSTILEIIINYKFGTWQPVIDSSRLELEDISNIIDKPDSPEYPYYPAKEDIFRSLVITPLDEVRVIIVGQDPYPSWAGSYPTGMGLSFSVRVGDKIPKSLQSIFKLVKKDYPDFEHPGHGDLTEWAQQGVLMLNMSLTVAPGQPNSHGIIWHGFIQRLLTAVIEERKKAPGLTKPMPIIVTWGKEAQSIKNLIADNSYYDLSSVHPAARGAYQETFVNCGHFRKINRLLTLMGDTAINWQLTPCHQLT